MPRRLAPVGAGGKVARLGPPRAFTGRFFSTREYLGIVSMGRVFAAAAQAAEKVRFISCLKGRTFKACPKPTEGYAAKLFIFVITSVTWACGPPIGMKKLFHCHPSTSVILSGRSESKDPYTAHPLSPGTFFAGAGFRVCSRTKLGIC